MGVYEFSMRAGKISYRTLRGGLGYGLLGTFGCSNLHRSEVSQCIHFFACMFETDRYTSLVLDHIFPLCEKVDMQTIRYFLVEEGVVVLSHTDGKLFKISQVQARHCCLMMMVVSLRARATTLFFRHHSRHPPRGHHATVPPRESHPRGGPPFYGFQ